MCQISLIAEELSVSYENPAAGGYTLSDSTEKITFEPKISSEILPLTWNITSNVKC
jgi:hypothetical protein